MSAARCVTCFLAFLFILFLYSLPVLFAEQQIIEEALVSEVLQISLEIRDAEESYEHFLRLCHNTAPDQTNPEQHGRKEEACSNTEKARVGGKKARQQFHALMDRASRSSIPSEWLRAHFTWVRWSPEWKRSRKEVLK